MNGIYTTRQRVSLILFIERGEGQNSPSEIVVTSPAKLNRIPKRVPERAAYRAIRSRGVSESMSISGVPCRMVEDQEAEEKESKKEGAVSKSTRLVGPDNFRGYEGMPTIRRRR